MFRDRSKNLTLCRACGGRKFYKALSLGKSPLANSFLKKSALKKKELFFPLNLMLCKGCGLLQLADIVNPDLMFKNYLYVSSTSKSFRDHFENFAQDVYKTFKLGKGDLVIDIGSNDGILLRPFKKLGVEILGVDPAKNVAQIAKKNGIDTVVAYFDERTAKRIVKKYDKAKVITATNVFAHTDDWDEMVDGINTALTDDGVFIIEVPYLLDFIQKNLFDTVYHEHLSYLTIGPLVNFFKKHNMTIFKVKRVASHGGSIRVFVKKNTGPYKVQESLKGSLELERHNGLFSIKTYEKFAETIDSNKRSLLYLLKKLKKDGNRIVGYGAPAKGNTLLNYFGINSDLIDYIVDDSKLKQNYYTPGTHIFITSPKKLKNDKFDYLLILAWNFSDAIIKNNAYLKHRGVKFIIPVPVPRVKAN